MKRRVSILVVAFSVLVGTADAQDAPEAMAPIAVWPGADGKYLLHREDIQRTGACDLPPGLVRLPDDRIERTHNAAWRAESFALSMNTGGGDDCDSGPTQLVTFLPATLNRSTQSTPIEHEIRWSPMTPDSISVRIESALFSHNRVVRDAHTLRLATEAGLVTLTAAGREGNFYHYSGDLIPEQRDALLSTPHPLLRTDVSLVDELPNGTRLVRGGDELAVDHGSYELTWHTQATPWRAHVDLTTAGLLPLEFSWAAAISQFPTTAPTSNALDSNGSAEVSLQRTPLGWTFAGLPPGTTDIEMDVTTRMGTGKIAVSVGRENVVSFHVVAADNTSTWQVTGLPGNFKLCERRDGRWDDTLSLPKDDVLPRTIAVHVTTSRCSEALVRPANITLYPPAAVGANQRTSANIELEFDSAEPERLRVWVSGAERLLGGTVLEWPGRSVSGAWGDCSGDACSYVLQLPQGVGSTARVPLEFSVAGLAPGTTIYTSTGTLIDNPSYTVVATSWKPPGGLRRLVPMLSTGPSWRFELASHSAFRFLRTDHELKCHLANNAAYVSCGHISRTGPSGVTVRLTNNDARTRLSASDQSLNVEVQGIEEFGGELEFVLFTAACNFEFAQRSPLISGVTGGQVWFEVSADSENCVEAPLKLANSATLAFGLSGWRERAWSGPGRARRFWVADVVKADITNGARMEVGVLFSNGTRADGVGTAQASVRLDIQAPVRWSDVGLDVEVPAPGATEPALLRHAEQMGLNRRNFLRVPRQEGLTWRVFVLDHGAFEPCASNWETTAYDAPPDRQVYPAQASNGDELTGRGVANGHPAYCFMPRHRVSDNKLRVEFRLEPLLSELVELDAGWPLELGDTRVRVGSRRLAPTKEAKTYLFPVPLTSGSLHCGRHQRERTLRVQPNSSPVPMRAREANSCEVRFAIPDGTCGNHGIITTESPQALRIQLHIRPSGEAAKSPTTLRDVVIGAGHSVPGVRCEEVDNATTMAIVQLGDLERPGIEVGAYDELAVEVRHLRAGDRIGRLTAARTFTPDNYTPAAETRLEFRVRYVPRRDFVITGGQDRSEFGFRFYFSAHLGLGMARYPHSGRGSTMSSEVDGTETIEFDYGVLLVGELWDFGANDAPWPVLNPQFHFGLLLPKSSTPLNDFSLVAGLGLRIPVGNPPGESALPLQLLPTLWYELSFVDGSAFPAMVFGVRVTAGMVLGN